VPGAYGEDRGEGIQDAVSRRSAAEFPSTKCQITNKVQIANPNIEDDLNLVFENYLGFGAWYLEFHR
jgi:hypothetical protein